ncbi:MAG: TIR domain-containing protein [archaeon]|nr:TIR domain-containing protein [archaeon]
MSELHRIYISCDYAHDGEYRDRFLEMDRYWRLFSSARMRDDTEIVSDPVRRTAMDDVRRDWIRDSTVLVLLCGRHTRYCPIVDREVASAMTNNYTYSRLGILVIALPDSGNNECLCGEDSVLYDRYGRHDRPDTMYELSRLLPGVPMRIIDSIRSDCPISVVSWDHVVKDHDRLVELIDRAHRRRSTNRYDNSCQLR